MANLSEHPKGQRRGADQTRHPPRHWPSQPGCHQAGRVDTPSDWSPGPRVLALHAWKFSWYTATDCEVPRVSNGLIFCWAELPKTWDDGWTKALWSRWIFCQLILSLAGGFRGVAGCHSTVVIFTLNHLKRAVSWKLKNVERWDLIRWPLTYWCNMFVHQQFDEWVVSSNNIRLSSFKS